MHASHALHRDLIAHTPKCEQRWADREPCATLTFPRLPCSRVAVLLQSPGISQPLLGHSHVSMCNRPATADLLRAVSSLLGASSALSSNPSATTAPSSSVITDSATTNSLDQLLLAGLNQGMSSMTSTNPVTSLQQLGDQARTQMGAAGIQQPAMPGFNPIRQQVRPGEADHPCVIRRLFFVFVGKSPHLLLLLSELISVGSVFTPSTKAGTSPVSVQGENSTTSGGGGGLFPFPMPQLGVRTRGRFGHRSTTQVLPPWVASELQRVILIGMCSVS